MLVVRMDRFRSKIACFGFRTKKPVGEKLILAVVTGCPVEVDMYVYIHIASGIYLQTYVGYAVGWLEIKASGRVFYFG